MGDRAITDSACAVLRSTFKEELSVGRAKIGVVIHTTLRDRIFTREDLARLNQLGDVTWTDSPEPISVEEACAILADCAR